MQKLNLLFVIIKYIVIRGKCIPCIHKCMDEGMDYYISIKCLWHIIIINLSKLQIYS